MSAGAIVWTVVALVIVVAAIICMGSALVLLILNALDPYNDEYRETRKGGKHGRNS